MAQTAQPPNQLEGLFDRLHQLMDSGSHSKVVKVADQSEWDWCTPRTSTTSTTL